MIRDNIREELARGAGTLLIWALEWSLPARHPGSADPSAMLPRWPSGLRQRGLPLDSAEMNENAYIRA